MKKELNNIWSKMIFFTEYSIEINNGRITVPEELSILTRASILSDRNKCFIKLFHESHKKDNLSDWITEKTGIHLKSETAEHTETARYGCMFTCLHGKPLLLQRREYITEGVKLKTKLQLLWTGAALRHTA